MKKNSSIKPQDIAIILFISTDYDGTYKLAEIAKCLNISLSETSEALKRAKNSRLIGQNKNIFRQTLFEFLVYGIKVTFPAIPGSIVRGIPTAHSGPPLDSVIVGGNENYVWKDSTGTARGMSIDPLYKSIPKIILEFPKFYELLCLVDAIRIGRAREVNLAIEILRERLVPIAK